MIAQITDSPKSSNTHDLRFRLTQYEMENMHHD